jgi:hypothetical protein
MPDGIDPPAGDDAGRWAKDLMATDLMKVAIFGVAA